MLLYQLGARFTISIFAYNFQICIFEVNFNIMVLDAVDKSSNVLTMHFSMKHLQKRICSLPMTSFMFKEGLRGLSGSASISLVSVLKRHFSNNVKFCSGGIVSPQALH